MQCQMDHIVLNVTDMEKTIEFYTSILKMPEERLAAWRDGKVPFPSVRLSAATIIDLFPPGMWSKSVEAGVCGTHLNHFCLAMSKNSWEALRKRLADHGIAVEEGPVKRWGAHGTGNSIYFRDPERNLIEARYYAGKDDHDTCLLNS